ncbi:MATE family efflux transporter [uncultured Eubacterium sp.]|uniref:MATE family efflux transporter n=1 Tax=Eubacterium sp. TaxID=142586 RepID=UPI002673D2B4|nr:MATE family efflux transporter [uncultured Eubacterium sp.]
MYYDLTKGKISKSLIMFTIPMIAGNLLQQFYNIADTLIVGQVLGKNALAAVGSAYTLMIFLTSIFLGLSMGAGALFSIYRGNDSDENLRIAVGQAFSLIMLVTIVLNIAVYILINPIMIFLQVPDEVYRGMKIYLLIIFIGLIATSLYNFFSYLLRALGNSVVPLIFLAVSTVLNIGLDLLFVVVFPWGIKGAAIATVISQYVSAVGIGIYVVKSCRELLPKRSEWRLDKKIFKEIINLSSLTCLQQSVMNFGILMVQGLVNSFGTTIMAAFTAGVKIDTFAYLPVQDFGNAFSTFVAQNYGAEKHDRIRKGTREAFAISIIFSIIISALVCIFAAPLMKIFVSSKDVEVIAAGVKYLRIEGAFYCGIGCLFLLYGYYRAINKAEMSVVLTVISLGMRVILAYILSAIIGETGIWLAIPIGWVLADITGIAYMKAREKTIFSKKG